MGKSNISPELLNKLRKQKESMRSDSNIINNQTLTKMRLRALPSPSDTPGKQYTSVYCRALGKKGRGTTSPLSFGGRCAIDEFLRAAFKGKDAKLKAFCKDAASVTNEYWMAVIDQNDPGDAEHPNVKIFRCKYTPYQAILEKMMDEDEGTDITHPITGRDFIVKKTGQDTSTKWFINFLDPSPISDDDAYVKAVKAVAKTTDPTESFYTVNGKTYREIYEYLTGEPLPEEFDEWVPQAKSDDDDDDNQPTKRPSLKRPVKDEEPADDEPADDADETADDDEPAEEEAEPTPARRRTPAPEPEPEDDSVSEPVVGDRVKFLDDKNETIEGKVTQVTNRGKTRTLVALSDANEEWELNIEDCEVVPKPKAGPVRRTAGRPSPKTVEAEPEEETEAEAESVTPKRSKKFDTYKQHDMVRFTTADNEETVGVIQSIDGNDVVIDASGDEHTVELSDILGFNHPDLAETPEDEPEATPVVRKSSVKPENSKPALPPRKPGALPVKPTPPTLPKKGSSPAQSALRSKMSSLKK